MFSRTKEYEALPTDGRRYEIHDGTIDIRERRRAALEARRVS